MLTKKNQITLHGGTIIPPAGISMPDSATPVSNAALTEGDVHGLVVQFPSGGYLFVSHSRIEQLDGRLMASLLGKTGRPKLAGEAKRLAIYLDEASITIARELGGGNVSKGIRTALGVASAKI